MKTRNGDVPSGIEKGMKQPSAFPETRSTLMLPPSDFHRSPMTMGVVQLTPMTVSSKTNFSSCINLLIQHRN